MFQLGLMFSARYWFIDHLLLGGDVFTNTYNNYDKSKSSLSPAGSTLPRVHAYIHDYVRNDVYLNNLQASYSADLGDGFYGQVYGDCLETTYAGVGFELPYCLLNTSWALGAGVSYVKQCDWDNMIRFADYSTSISFVTAYWNPSTLSGILMRLSVGQYLTKDKGAIIDVAKRFDSGVAVGVRAATSSVSRDDYGEGGFGKGFYISAPSSLMTIGPNRNRTVVSQTPLTCDGRQVLSHKYQFYPMTAE